MSFSYKNSTFKSETPFFQSDYDIWSSKNFYNLLIFKYNKIPDYIKIYPQGSMKDYYFDFQNVVKELNNISYWESVFKDKKFSDFKAILKNDVAEDLNCSEVFKNLPVCWEIMKMDCSMVWDETMDEYNKSTKMYDSPYDYSWGDEDSDVEKVGDILPNYFDALENEARNKKKIRVINTKGEIYYLNYDFSRAFLLDKEKLNKIIKDKNIFISNDFFINIIIDTENVFPYIFYNVETPLEKFILNSVIDVFKKYIVKHYFESKAVVSFLTVSNHSFSTKDMEIEDVIKTNESLFMHTNEGFNKVHEDTLKFLNSNESGLCIFRGDPGTGKTSYIKYLTTIVKLNSPTKKILFISAGIMNNFSDPGFISFLSNHKDSIIILEDCEQLLADRNNSMGGFVNSGLLNLLNMSDGILGSAFKFKFICTFNSDLAKVDYALLRKGRCKINYKFDKLSVDKIKYLAENGLIEDPYSNGLSEKPMTVAEIYNQEAEEFKNEKKRVVGFGG